MKRPKLLLATTNPGKIKEIKKYLTSLPIEILALKEINFRENYLEKGSTFLENARGKAIFYSKHFGGLTLAEDSGLEIEKLKGAPGVYSARFAGEEGDDEKNIQKVLSLMRGVPQEERKARFVSTLILARQGKIIKEIVETVEGYILEEKKGNYGFGYDPIFYYSPLAKTFAQLLPEEKNKVSHRGKGLKRLREFLEEYFKTK
ncbi:MAG: RdgB/HAM1 family non-canonical purine NTP pyrophosphatase [Candidatus Aminicenantia bacterium]